LPFFGEFEADLFRKIQHAKYILPKDISEGCKGMINKIFKVKTKDRPSALAILKDEWLSDVEVPTVC